MASMRRAYRRDMICATQRFQEQRFVNFPKMSVKPSKAMVLAAGLGVRMRPLTDRMPKPLVRVAGRALLDHVLDKLGDAGVGEAVVNVHYLPDQIIDHTAARVRPRVIISDERDVVLGTGGGVVKALPLLGAAPFLHLNADTVWIDGVRPNLIRLAESFDAARMDALLLLAATSSSVGYAGRGDFAMAPDGRLRRRPEREVAPFIYAGVAILIVAAAHGRPVLVEIFEELEEERHLLPIVEDLDQRP